MKLKMRYISLLTLIFMIGNSVFAKTPFIFPVDIDYDHPEIYLMPGTQSTIDTENLQMIKQEISISKNDLAGIAKIYFWMKQNFTVFHGGGQEIGRNTINRLLKRKSASGCHDHGLIFSSVLRYFGYPAIMVDAGGIQCAEKGNNDSGHIFIEIFVEGKWILADSNSGEYIPDYDHDDPVIPITKSVENKGYYVLYKGVDPAGYGVKSNTTLMSTQTKLARRIHKLDLQYPDYTIMRFGNGAAKSNKRFPDGIAVLGKKISAEYFANKYCAMYKGMSPNFLLPDNPYQTIIYLKTPDVRSNGYVDVLFKELMKDGATNYLSIKKVNGKTLVYLDAENESKLLELIDNFGKYVDLDNLGNEVKTINL